MKAACAFLREARAFLLEACAFLLVMLGAFIERIGVRGFAVRAVVVFGGLLPKMDQPQLQEAT